MNMASSHEREAAELLLALARESTLEKAVASIEGLTVNKARDLLCWAAKTLRERQPVSTVTQDSKSFVKPESKTPALGTLRVFSDGAARGNPGLAGAGALILDESGEVVDSLRRFLGTTTNNVAEYEGVILGLARALDLGAKRVELYCDSELLVRQISGRYKVRAAHLRPLFETVTELLREFDSYSLRHVPREKNAEADALANEAIDDRADEMLSD